MGNKLGITEGVWEVDPTDAEGRTVSTVGGRAIAECGLDYSSLEPKNGKNNARLIAEAGTVANETGLTPRQLKEQRDELLQVLKNVSNELNAIDNGVHPKIEMAIAMADAGIARAAIAKAREDQ